MTAIADRARLLPSADRVTYLNTGSAGPLLRPVADAMSRALATELEEGRAGESAWQEFLAGRIDVRRELGALIGAEPDEIALTRHTTEGLNIALWGHPWQPGDRLLITSLEHDAGIAAAATLARRFDLVLDVLDVGAGAGDDVLAALRAALAQPARLLLTSHVAWSTGALLPVAEMAALAHASGCAVLVDGAQAVGATPVDVSALDADFYAYNGYKWLCGPEGTGVLAVRRAWLDRLLPSFGGAFGVAGGSVDARHPLGIRPADGAARYESGSMFRPHLAGLLAAARHHRELQDAGAGTTRIAAVVGYAADRLAGMGAEILTPPAQRAGLLTFALPDLDARSAVAELERVGVVVRSIPGTQYLRISCAAFVTTDDIDVLVAQLERLVSSSPTH